MRLDTFLYRVRYARTRGRVQHLLAEGKVRIDGRRAEKPGLAVREGMVLTLPFHGSVRVLRILSLPERRGPASEARGCYEELGKDANDSHQAPSD
ncbi:S4 domain-containing protein [Sphingomicrobium lutaoense]|uniref:Ribosome-associated heat shock protein Hsp15 n=1 Tax=Sphingomicrobium lutaoense TaxID=515949 RepID=A0A839Z7B0_9SPHN|nr:S4 domain-containing protein [Sphingomicrobium lutaoense]MBB3764704.1 ribosome-associated heat shock protein Hsp15 [Sphingomicrobium lutaoense]